MKKHFLTVIAIAILMLMTFAVIPASAYMAGDVDGIDGISSADARLALRAAVGLEKLSEEAAAAADVDGEPGISSADARLILRAAVGLENLHTHVFKETVTKKATCTENGVKTFTCECNEDTYTEDIPATGHTPGKAATCKEAQTCTACNAELKAKLPHNYSAVVTMPTCTLGGYTTHTCSVCNHEYKDTETPAKGHTPGKAATCTEAQLCTECEIQLAAKLGHNMSVNKTVAPTCNEKGYTIYKCSRCTHTENRNYKNAAHTWKTEYTVDKQADCTNPGSKSIHCQKCSAVKPGSSVTITPRSHDIKDNGVKTAATCTTPGVMNQKCTKTASTAEYKACTYTSTRAIPVDADAHTGKANVIKGNCEATCTEKGYTGDTYWSCCDTLYLSGEEIEIDADAHTGEANIVKGNSEATCIAKGYTGDTYWSCCDVLYAIGEEIEIDADAHTGEANVIKGDYGATCIAKGYTGDAYWSCCDVLYAIGEEIKIDENAHKAEAEYIETLAPTCVAKGEEKLYCEYCDEVLDVREVAIDENAHKAETEYIETLAPTCVAKGEEKLYCEYCDAVLDTKDVAIDADAHKAEEEYIVTLTPTCAKKGEKKLFCEYCNSVLDVKDIDATSDHKYGTLKEEIPSEQCKDGKVAHYTCSVCKKNFDTSYNELSDSELIIKSETEHDFHETVIPPTCMDEGYTADICIRCSSMDGEAREFVESYGTHIFEVTETIPPTCTSQGIKTKTCQREITIKGETTVCGVEEKEYFGEIEGHDFAVIDIIEEATCIKTGTVKVKCQRLSCGLEEEQTTPIAPCTPSDDAETIRGSGDNYCKKVVKCAVPGCSKIVSENNTQGHTMRIDNKSWVDATCTTPETVDSYCRYCNYRIEDEVTNDPLGHLLNEVGNEPASCQKAGYIEYEGKCTRCGEGEEGQTLTVVLPQKPHDPDGIATCTRAVNCNVCHQQVEAALGHDYRFRAAAYNSDVTAFSCTRCGHIPSDKATNLSTFNTIANKIKNPVFANTVNRDHQLVYFSKSEVDTKYSKFDFGFYTSTIKKMYEDEMANTAPEYSPLRKTSSVRTALPINDYNVVSALEAGDIDSIKIEKLNGIDVRSVLSQFSDTFTVGKNNYDITPYKNKTVTEDVIKVTLDIKNEKYTQMTSLPEGAMTALEKIYGVNIRDDAEQFRDPDTGKLQRVEQETGDGYSISMVMTLNEIKSDALVTFYFAADTYEPIMVLYNADIVMEQSIDMSFNMGISMNGEMDPIITTKYSTAYLFPNYFA